MIRPIGEKRGCHGLYTSMKSFLGRFEHKICIAFLFGGWIFPTIILFLSGSADIASISVIYLIVFPVSLVLFILSFLSLRVYSRWFWLPILVFFLLSIPVLLWNFDF